MAPVMAIPPGIWKHIRPKRFCFSPVSGWKALSYNCFARIISSLLVPFGSCPNLEEKRCITNTRIKNEIIYDTHLGTYLYKLRSLFASSRVLSSTKHKRGSVTHMKCHSRPLKVRKSNGEASTLIRYSDWNGAVRRIINLYNLDLKLHIMRHA